jgi:hypothetical protein
VHNINAENYLPHFPHEYLLTEVSGAYQQSINLESVWDASGDPLFLQDGDFFSAGAHFTDDGYGDIVIGHKVFHGGPNGIQSTTTLPVTASETAHYTYWQGRLVADLNGSGLPGLLKEESNDGTTSNFLSGAKYSLYLNDGHGHLTDATANLPANLGLNDFGQDMRDLDAEFKGCPDVVPQHANYIFNDPNPSLQSHPDILLINDCTAHFTKGLIDDPILDTYAAGLPYPPEAANYQLIYFVKTSDPKRYYVVYANYDGLVMARAVTPDYPLTITPM